jgi:hypothetical protein
LRYEVFGFLTREFSASLTLIELHGTTSITKVGMARSIQKLKQLLHLRM